MVKIGEGSKTKDPIGREQPTAYPNLMIYENILSGAKLGKSMVIPKEIKRKCGITKVI